MSCCKKALIRECMIVGLGHPILDLLAKVEPELLERYDLNEDDAIISTEKHATIYDELIEKCQMEYLPGGDIQNVLRILQWHLEKPNATVFYGCIGDDDYGKMLKDKVKEDGVNVRYQYDPQQPTGTCAVLITGYHRSLIANLGASQNFTIDYLKKPENWDFIIAANYFYTSGYTVVTSFDSLLELANYALANQKKFLLNMSAPFIAKDYSEQLMQVMPYVDIVFGNNFEYEAFANQENFGTEDINEIGFKMCQLPKSGDYPRLVVITRSEEPVLTFQGSTLTNTPIIPIPEELMVDTNGAGDAFVGGFLAQYIQHQSLDVCVRCGIWTASKIIQQSGCSFKGKAEFVY